MISFLVASATLSLGWYLSKSAIFKTFFLVTAFATMFATISIDADVGRTSLFLWLLFFIEMLPVGYIYYKNLDNHIKMTAEFQKLGIIGVEK